MKDSLDTLLYEWEVKPLPDPGFEIDVWRRIGSRDHGSLVRFLRSLGAPLARPSWAAATIAAMIAIGAAGGSLWHRRELRHERADAITAYVLSVDPIAHVDAHRP